MSQNGFIKLYRSLFSHSIWTAEEKFDIRSAWIDMIQSAAFAPTFVIKRGKSIQLDVGEFVASRRDLAAKWRWSETKVVNTLGIFEKNGMIDRRKDQGETVIILCNYAALNGIQPMFEPPKKPAERQPQSPGANQRKTTLLYIEKKKRTKENTYTPQSPLIPQKKERGDSFAVEERDGGGSASVVAPSGAEWEGGNAGALDKAPAFDTWCSYAVNALGWVHSEEYEGCWKYFEAKKDSQGRWRDKNNRPITNWKLHCEQMCDFWAVKSGRRRLNFRRIDECIGDGIDPLFWREEYAAMFKMKSIDGIDKYFSDWPDLVERDYGKATKIMERCIKNHPENRKLFNTQYVAEMGNERELAINIRTFHEAFRFLMQGCASGLSERDEEILTVGKLSTIKEFYPSDYSMVVAEIKNPRSEAYKYLKSKNLI